MAEPAADRNPSVNRCNRMPAPVAGVGEGRWSNSGGPEGYPGQGGWEVSTTTAPS